MTKKLNSFYRSNSLEALSPSTTSGKMSEKDYNHAPSTKSKMNLLVDNTNLFCGEEEKPPSPVSQLIKFPPEPRFLPRNSEKEMSEEHPVKHSLFDRETTTAPELRKMHNEDVWDMENIREAMEQAVRTAPVPTTNIENSVEAGKLGHPTLPRNEEGTSPDTAVSSNSVFQRLSSPGQIMPGSATQSTDDSASGSAVGYTMPQRVKMYADSDFELSDTETPNAAASKIRNLIQYFYGDGSAAAGLERNWRVNALYSDIVSHTQQDGASYIARVAPKVAPKRESCSLSPRQLTFEETGTTDNSDERKQLVSNSQLNKVDGRGQRDESCSNPPGANQDPRPSTNNSAGKDNSDDT